jgi:hypothetical protein
MYIASVELRKLRQMGTTTQVATNIPPRFGVVWMVSDSWIFRRYSGMNVWNVLEVLAG